MQWLLPPILWIIAVGVAMAVGFLFPAAKIVAYPFNWIGALLIVIGLGLTMLGSKRFRMEQTNIMTFNDPDKLVTTGLFSWTRNPMYLGFCTSLFGVALSANHIGALIPAVVFFLACVTWYIPFEEAAALRKFGSQYEEYCQRVRRWF